MILKGSGCLFPFPACTVGRDSFCAEAGTKAPARDVNDTVLAQLRNVLMSDCRGADTMRIEAEMSHSLNSMVPVLSEWAGLGNRPRMLYLLPGFDPLHKCFSCYVRVLSFSSCLVNVPYWDYVLCIPDRLYWWGCHFTNGTLHIYTGLFLYCTVVASTEELSPSCRSPSSPHSAPCRTRRSTGF